MFRFSSLIFSALFIYILTTAIPAEAHIIPSSHSSEKQLWGEKPPETKDETEKEKEQEAETETESFKTAETASGKQSAIEPDLSALPPWLEYAVSIPDVEEDAPIIAIVIDDLGLNRSLTQAALSLPAPLTLSFLSYADDLQQQTEQARMNGHELLLHVPMEPVNSRFNPGPNALRSGMSAEEISEKLENMLSSFDGYVGINNHMGSKFTSDPVSMAVVINTLKEKGLLFLDSLTSDKSTGWKTARDRHVPYAVRDIFLDNAHDEKNIMKQLSLLENHALKRRTAVAICHPHPTTINTLKKWIPQARKKGFVFVPISMIALVKQDAF